MLRTLIRFVVCCLDLSYVELSSGLLSTMVVEISQTPDHKIKLHWNWDK